LPSERLIARYEISGLICHLGKGLGGCLSRSGILPDDPAHETSVRGRADHGVVLRVVRQVVDVVVGVAFPPTPGDSQGAGVHDIGDPCPHFDPAVGRLDSHPFALAKT